MSNPRGSTAGATPVPLPDDAPMTLDEAAEVLLRGAVTAATLRAAIGRRELAYERIGRRIMVTPADIRAWRERCRIPARDRPSGSWSLESNSLTFISPSEIKAQRAQTRSVLDDLARMKSRAATAR